MNSQWNGLLINFNKRTSHHFSLGVSYTYSKGIDDGLTQLCADPAGQSESEGRARHLR